MQIKFGFIITAAAILAAVPAFGQGRGGYQPPTGPAPKMADGHPDFSGLWQRPYTPDMSITATDLNGKQYPLENPPAADDAKSKQGKGGRGAGRGPRKLPYTAWGAENWKAYTPEQGDYTGACLPFGLMRSMNSPDPIQIMQSKEYMSLLYEQNTWFKVFQLDGHAHDPKATPTWFGDSVGHWEGDALVVDTTNFNGRTRLDTNGHPHSDKLHIIERFTRPDLGHINYQVIIDDPKTYTEKWKNERTFTLRTDWHIMEYSCEENNKSFWEGRIKIPNYDSWK
ncbi:MAG TPA: hypothetical protein VH639_04805 [Bryobacteraceae bacterium]